MKKILKMLWIISLFGFSSYTLASNQDLGTVVGGIAGGLIGNNMGHGSGRAISTIGGAVIGGLVGNQMGRTADDSDRYIYSHCAPHSHWQSCSHPNYYPHYGTFIGRDGRVCRRDIFINEFGERIYVTNCCVYMNPNRHCVRWERFY